MSGMIYTPPTTSNGVPITIQPARNTVWEFLLQSFPGLLTSGTSCLSLGSLEAECLSKDEHSYSSDLLGRCFSEKVKEGKQNRAGIKLPRDRGSFSWWLSSIYAYSDALENSLHHKVLPTPRQWASFLVPHRSQSGWLWSGCDLPLERKGCFCWLRKILWRTGHRCDRSVGSQWKRAWLIEVFWKLDENNSGFAVGNDQVESENVKINEGGKLL